MTALKELMDMRERTVLITGATGYLGRTIADALAELGANLILVDRPGSDFYSLEDELDYKWGSMIKVISCDLELEDEREELISVVKSNNRDLSCLINNAAFAGAEGLEGWVVPFEEQGLEAWRRALEVNLSAVFHLSKGLVPELRLGEGGNIINITSIYGEFGPDWRLYEGTEMGNPAAYGASKGGLAQFTRWLATTVAPDIRVNAISPGGVFRNQPDAFVKRYEDRTPLKRMATEDDFRGAIAYLASDMSKYVTGQILRVDGGWGEW